MGATQGTNRMASPAQPPNNTWPAEFSRLAFEQDASWLVPPDAAAPLSGYAAGLSPQEELSALKDMSEWRGCGRGGGS
jgi:hypothetical protein